jgi:NADPH2:quinone reductase
MRAIEITQPAACPMCPAALRAPLPVLKAGEVLIKVHRRRRQPPDVFQRLGQYPVPPGASDLPGLEVAGEIVDGDLQRRQRLLEVAGEGRPGVRAGAGRRLCRILRGAAGSKCLPVPKGLSDARSGLAARKPSLPSGATCLSAPPEQPAKPCWCRAAARASASRRSSSPPPWATACSPPPAATTNAAPAMELGAERGINYKTEDFGAVVKELTGGKGVDVVLDMVGGDYVPREIACLADDGRIAIIALLGGARRGRPRPGAAPAPDHHRLDPASAPGRLQGAIAQKAARARVAAHGGRQNQAGDPQGLSAGARLPPATR